MIPTPGGPGRDTCSLSPTASEGSEFGIGFAVGGGLPSGHRSQPQRSEESLVGSAPVLLHRLTYPSDIPASLDRGRRRPLAPAQPEPPSPTRIPPRRAATSPSLRTSRPCRLPWGADHRVLAFNSRGRQDPGWLCFTLEPTDERERAAEVPGEEPGGEPGLTLRSPAPSDLRPAPQSGEGGDAVQEAGPGPVPTRAPPPGPQDGPGLCWPGRCSQEQARYSPGSQRSQEECGTHLGAPEEGCRLHLCV